LELEQEQYKEIFFQNLKIQNKGISNNLKKINKMIEIGGPQLD
jgi:hypothetical protein